MVNRLIKDGLVARKRSEDDRRVVTVRLTPAGRSELEKRQDMVRKHTARLLAELPDEKKTELIDAISVIVRVLGSLVEPEE
jgi:DNA-binding MarR family transcriptional regulator